MRQNLLGREKARLESGVKNRGYFCVIIKTCSVSWVVCSNSEDKYVESLRVIQTVELLEENKADDME